MSASLQHWHRDVIEGTGPSAVRGLLSAIEVPYALIMRARNLAFDRGVLSSSAAARPTICIGNITTGGTGKTPVVAWLAARLLVAGHLPAILTRGYHGGDEQRVLQRMLPQIIVQAKSSRREGAREALVENEDISCFLLDDGFQHRKLRRDFDLVLIDATQPFGFNHVLPRGLLREPLCGLRRADAFLITHIESASSEVLDRIVQTLRQQNPPAPIYRSAHRTVLPNDVATDRKAFAFCGIGNPSTFIDQLSVLGVQLAGSRSFADHHNYSAVDLNDLEQSARASGSEQLITTQKDWVKVQPLLKAMPATNLPIFPADVRIEFAGEDEAALFAQILSRLTARVLAMR